MHLNDYKRTELRTEAVSVSFLRESIFSPLPLHAAAMIYSAVTSWRPQLFLLAGR